MTEKPQLDVKVDAEALAKVLGSIQEAVVRAGQYLAVGSIFNAHRYESAEVARDLVNAQTDPRFLAELASFGWWLLDAAAKQRDELRRAQDGGSVRGGPDTD